MYFEFLIKLYITFAQHTFLVTHSSLQFFRYFNDLKHYFVLFPTLAVTITHHYDVTMTSGIGCILLTRILTSPCVSDNIQGMILCFTELRAIFGFTQSD